MIPKPHVEDPVRVSDRVSDKITRKQNDEL
jgi:hypothetical protein